MQQNPQVELVVGGHMCFMCAFSHLSCSVKLSPYATASGWGARACLLPPLATGVTYAWHSQHSEVDTCPALGFGRNVLHNSWLVKVCKFALVSVYPVYLATDF